MNQYCRYCTQAVDISDDLYYCKVKKDARVQTIQLWGENGQGGHMTATKGHGFVLVQTSSCCPEQYDVYSNGEVIGYLRLRNGYFTVECPDCGGELVYEALPLGDGMFLDNEREHFLNEAMKAIMQYCGARVDGE